MSEPGGVVNNPEQSRFESVTDGLTAVVDYELKGRKLQLLHTEVPAGLEGRGIAGRLVLAAMEHARAEKLQIVPVCPYVNSWLERHPEFSDILAD